MWLRWLGLARPSRGSLETNRREGLVLRNIEAPAARKFERCKETRSQARAAELRVFGRGQECLEESPAPGQVAWALLVSLKREQYSLTSLDLPLCAIVLLCAHDVSSHLFEVRHDLFAEQFQNLDRFGRLAAALRDFERKRL